jgi:hypothetical protein
MTDPKHTNFDSDSFTTSLISMFDNGSGAGKALAVASTYYDTDGDEWHDGQTEKAPRQEFNRLKIFYTIAGTAPTGIKLKVLTTIDGGTTEYTEDAIASIGTEVNVIDLILTLPFAVGNHSVRIPIDPGLKYKVQFLREGGSTDTSVLATGLFVRV